MGYVICAITDRLEKCFVSDLETKKPVIFETSDEAWEFVEKFMSMEQHPRLMCVKEFSNADS